MCSPLSFQVLGSNFVLQDLKLALPLSLVQLSQSQTLTQLQCLTTQRHNLVHLPTYHPTSNITLLQLYQAVLKSFW